MMQEQLLFAELPPVTRRLVTVSTRASLKLDQIKTQWDAFQALRCELESLVDRLGDVLASGSQIQARFGITPTTVRRLAARHQVRKVGRRRKRFHVRDVLLAVLHSGTGRIRRCRRTEPSQPSDN
jgi:hypothetical protein